MKDKQDKISRREMLASSAALGIWGAIPERVCAAQPPPRTPPEPWNPSEGSCKPMGEGKGLNPGRVVWVHNPEVATWDGVTAPMAVKSATGEWWDDANCNPKVVDAMFSTAIQGLTGKKFSSPASLLL